MCGTILCNYKRVILWFDLLKRLVDWICNNVILIRTPNILQFGWRWIEDLWNRITMNLWLWACWKSFVLHVLHVLFIFEGLWWKFFEALEAWIRRASLIYGLLRFLEVFELDSNKHWDLGIWFRWFLFECSLYLKVCDKSSSRLWRLESVELH